MSKELIPINQTINEAQLVAKQFVVGGLLPDNMNLEQAMAVVHYGRDLGMHAAQSLSEIYPIKNKIVLKTEVKLQLAYERISGFECEVLKSTDQECEVIMYRHGRHGKPQKNQFRYTRAEADLAGFTKAYNYKTKNSYIKDNWIKQI